MKDEKILSEEILSDEEIEIVAGGRRKGHGVCFDHQVSSDARFLKKFGYSSSVYDAWSELGITLKHDSFNHNQYLMGDKEISRKDAYIHAMKKRGWNQIAIDCFDEWSDYQF